MPNSREKLPPLPPLPHHQERALVSHFVVCPVCRQHFDCDDLDQVFHHGPEPHEPLTPEGLG